MNQKNIRQPIQALDLRSPEFKHSPGTTWQALIQQGPVVTTRQPLLGRIALTTRYEESQRVLRDTELFTVDARRCGHRNSAGLRWWVPGMFRPLADNLLTVDGSEHRTLRKRVDVAFRRSTLTELQPRIEQFASNAVTRLRQEIQTHGHADFVEHVARPVPQWVISCLLGLDLSYSQPDHPLNRALSTLGSVQGGSSLFRALPAIRLITRTFEDEIAIRRTTPREDLLSRLISVEGEGCALNDQQLLAMAFLLYIAGHETTTHLLSTSLLSVLTEPEIKEQISSPLDDRSIHEFVRFNSPVQMTKPRFVVRDVEFAGAILKRGDTIAALVGAANQDPNEFDEPARFMLSQASPKHLGFGTGAHACFGLHLALRETATVLNRVLFDSDIRLANITTPYQWNRRLGLRSLKHLVVTRQ